MVTNYHNQSLKDLSDEITDERISEFISNHRDAVSYLIAMFDTFKLTQNQNSEIDDWECDLENIMFL